MIAKSTYPYGASYSPLIFSESDWERDLSQMQAASMNLIRIGDVSGSWDRIEPREDDIQLDVLDLFYSAANRYGIQIMISTGTSSPPLWLATKYPDIFILSSHGERYPLGASYHWACVQNPIYLRAAENYLRKLAEFVAKRPNHFGWQISNEIGFPFMPARERNDLGLYCYCDHCQAQFRIWIHEKYKTLEALTEAWSWSTTNFVYNNWSEIFAPESMPASWSGVTRWLDWRLYMQDVFAHFAGWQHGIIRDIDPEHPTSVNTFNFKGLDRFGTFMGLDQWKLAAQVDHIGYDLYPGSGDKLKSRPEHNSIFLDHGRSVSKSADSTFWIHEIESGPIGGWILGPERNTDEIDIIRNGVEMLGHDAKLILYMPWREWGYQPLRWGALVDLDGNPTLRLDAASKLGAFIKEQSSFLASARTPHAEVALIESKPNAIFFKGVDQEEILFDAQRGTYLAFWEQGYSVDFLNLAQLTLDTLAGYKFVALPLMGLIGNEDANLLQAYVRQGGNLVGFARCATLDGRGWYHHRIPIDELGEVFGLEHISADTLKENLIDFDGQNFRGWLNRDRIELQATTEVLAKFNDGLPAVTFNHAGLGSGTYLATQADSGYVHGDGGLLGEILKSVSEKIGVHPRLKVISQVNRTVGIDPHILENDQSSMLFFSNYCRDKLEALVRLCLDGKVPLEVNRIFPNQQLAGWTISADELHIPLNFLPEEVIVIQIIWRKESIEVKA